MQPIWNEPVLRLDLVHDGRTVRYLVASELHIGIENELARRGAFLKSRTQKMADSLVALVEAEGATRLVLLGDIKHRVTHLTPQEHRDVPAFFRRFSGLEEVHIAQGNHDAGLLQLLPPKSFPNVQIHPASGFVLEGDRRVACLHGHARPHERLFDADAFLAGHTHVAVAFVDEQGEPQLERAWLRGRLDPALTSQRHGRESAAEVIVFPPFNPLCGGTAVNREGLLGPFGRLIDLANSRLYALDGRLVGSVAEIAASPLKRRRRPAAT